MGRNIENSGEYNQPIGEHYSNKGGHGERHDFQAQLRNSKGIKGLPVEMQQIIRRTMFRGPRDGR